MALRNNGNKIAVNETISNVSVNVIEITEDKLVNILNKHVSKIKKSNDWISATALFVSLVGILLTSTFNDVWIFTKDMLLAFFTLITILSLGYAIYTIMNCYKNRSGVQNIIKEIKGENNE